MQHFYNDFIQVVQVVKFVSPCLTSSNHLNSWVYYKNYFIVFWLKNGFYVNFVVKVFLATKSLPFSTSCVITFKYQKWRYDDKPSRNEKLVNKIKNKMDTSIMCWGN